MQRQNDRRQNLKKSLSIIICCALLLGLLSGCGDISIPFIGGGDDSVKQNSLPAAELSYSSANAEENLLRAAVLYDGSAGTGYWEDTCSRLSQPLLLGLRQREKPPGRDNRLCRGGRRPVPDERIL